MWLPGNALLPVALGLAMLGGLVVVLVAVRLRAPRKPDAPPSTTPHEPLQAPHRAVQPTWEAVREGETTVIKWQTGDGKASGESLALEPHQLRDVAVVAQALDNQWEPQALLAKMLRQGLTLSQVADERNRYVRAEYIRALINAEQVVINRAFLYNNPVVSTDFATPGSTREAFKDLLGAGAIVPYLFNERTPADAPSTFTSKDETAFEGWRRVCQEVRPQCVRLSWDDSPNAEQTSIMARRFDAWASSAGLGDPDAYVRALGLSAAEKEPFRQRLLAMRQMLGSRDTPVSREELYRAFISVEDEKAGIKIAHGAYRNEPFVAQLKQLIDLRYNTNLPDALGKYALTPIESLPRTALQELTLAQTNSEIIQPEQLLELLRQEVFGIAADAAYLRSMEQLTLDDVKLVRGTAEWAAYIQSLQALLADPFNFGHGASAVHDRYVALATQMTAVLKQRRVTVAEEKWLPRVSLLLTIGGAVLEAQWAPTGAGLMGQIAFNLAGSVAQNTVQRVVGRLIIRGAAGITSQANLETSIDFMNKRMARGADLWRDIEAQLREIPGCSQVERVDRQVDRENDPNINTAEAFVDPAMGAAA